MAECESASVCNRVCAPVLATTLAFLGFPFFVSSASAEIMSDISCENSSSPTWTHFEVSGGTASGDQESLNNRLTCKAGRFEFGLRNALVNVTTDDASTGIKGHLSGFTDTAASLVYDAGVYKLLEQSFSVKLTTDFNLPTGLTNLNVKQQAGLVDYDLVALNRYGEGFNAGIGAQIGTRLSPTWMLGLGAGHIFRGSYTPFASQGELAPGDRNNAVGSLIHTDGSLIEALSLSYASLGRADLQSQALYKPGSLVVAQLSVSNTFDGDFSAGATLSYTHSQATKRFISDATGSIVPAALQSGDEFYIAGNGSYFLSETTTLSANAYYRDRGDEQVDPVLLDNLPQRRIFGLSLEAQERMDNQFSLTERIFGQNIDDKPSKAFLAQSYQSIGLSLQITKAF